MKVETEQSYRKQSKEGAGEKNVGEGEGNIFEGVCASHFQSLPSRLCFPFLLFSPYLCVILVLSGEKNEERSTIFLAFALIR